MQPPHRQAARDGVSAREIGHADGVALGVGSGYTAKIDSVHSVPSQSKVAREAERNQSEAVEAVVIPDS